MSTPHPELAAAISEIPIAAEAGCVLHRDRDGWELVRDGQHIRYLNKFESSFVDSTIAAATDVMVITGWLHKYRRTTGGGGYVEACVGDHTDNQAAHPDPAEGFTWVAREPMYTPTPQYLELISVFKTDIPTPMPRSHEWPPRLTFTTEGVAGAWLLHNFGNDATAHHQEELASIIEFLIKQRVDRTLTSPATPA